MARMPRADACRIVRLMEVVMSRCGRILLALFLTAPVIAKRTHLFDPDQTWKKVDATSP
jgi:hypothetical protein